jgi:glycosyltransferase involved in cell wall biosynthesis
MKVLFLTPWYPSKKDEMSGLFVQKHVEAVRAQGVDVRVIHSQDLKDTWRQWRLLQRAGWIPDIVQLNVIQTQGLLALALLDSKNIPYIIVEHWSGYLPENGQFMRMSRIKRALYRHIAEEASMILTVSDRQAEAMQTCGMHNEHWRQINNVVDDFFFQPRVKSQESSVKTLLHVSCFDERAKNVKGLLRAAKMLSEKRQDWQLVLVGTGIDFNDVRRYADELDIPEGLLRWTGELTPREVADEMHRADAFVLSSRYETYGVVLAEAAAAGLPILSTPVGIADELAALLVPQEIAQNKPGTFAEFMETILWSPASSVKPQEHTDRFSAEAIGKKLKSIYEQALSPYRP